MIKTFFLFRFYVIVIKIENIINQKNDLKNNFDLIRVKITINVNILKFVNFFQKKKFF